MTARKIIEAGLYNAAVELMDDEIREELCNSGDYGTDESFLVAYMEAHETKYGVEFCLQAKEAVLWAIRIITVRGCRLKSNGCR